MYLYQTQGKEVLAQLGIKIGHIVKITKRLEQDKNTFSSNINTNDLIILN